LSYLFFNLNWIPKAGRKCLLRKWKESTKKIQRVQTHKYQQERRIKKLLKSYYMFNNIGSLTTSTSGIITCMKTLQYLREETNVTILNKCPTLKMVFKIQLMAPKSAAVERLLFSNGGLIMRPHRRNMPDSLFEELIMLKSSI
ncbi:hypothetical protein WA026_023802, partial [Henosepilachna vigintioctopunctata]